MNIRTNKFFLRISIPLLAVISAFVAKNIWGNQMNLKELADSSNKVFKGVSENQFRAFPRGLPRWCII
jgi:hypothetical protein